MAERFKAMVLKTIELKGSVGSNPTFSGLHWLAFTRRNCLNQKPNYIADYAVGSLNIKD